MSWNNDYSYYPENLHGFYRWIITCIWNMATVVERTKHNQLINETEIELEIYRSNMGTLFADFGLFNGCIISRHRIQLLWSYDQLSFAEIENLVDGFINKVLEFIPRGITIEYKRLGKCQCLGHNHQNDNAVFIDYIENTRLFILYETRTYRGTEWWCNECINNISSFNHYVYLMKNQDIDRYKIGHSKNPIERKHTLGREYEIIHVIPVSNSFSEAEKHESQLHHYFGEKRVWVEKVKQGKSEHFNLDNNEISVFCNLNSPYDVAKLIGDS